MTNKARNTSGKFAAKSEVPRKVRSVNLTDTAWQWLAEVAAQAGVSRNDYIEAMAEGNTPFMETVISEASPIMETVESDNAKIAEQPQNSVPPIMETVDPEKESLRQELEEIEKLRHQLEGSDRLVARKNQELQAMGGVLAAANQKIFDRDTEIERLEAELADLKQNLAPASQELPEAADLLNQLKAKRKKSAVTLADVEMLLELLEG